VIANTLLLAAERRNGATVLTRMRAEGLWRTSRPFREGEAARIVLAQLGPGMIRGDCFAGSGTVGPGAQLIVAGQMATRILPGREPVTTSATWSVEEGGMLDLYAEPTMICDGAIYEARLTIALTGDARAIVSEIVACAPSASARFATNVTRDGNAALIDVLKLDPEARAPIADVIGTLLILGPADHKTLDQVAEDCPNVRVGIGTFHQGDSIARIVGTQVEPVREAIARLRAASNPEGAWGAPRPHRGHSEPATARRADSAVQT
jgi:urease accessory protein UreH